MKLLCFSVLFLAATTSASGSDYRTFHAPIENQLPYFLKAQITPIWNISSIDRADLITMPEFSLESTQDPQLTHADIAGKVAIVNFFFASCKGYCPKITNNIRKVYRAVQKHPGVRFLSLTVTPQADSLDRLREFAQSYGIDGPHWHLVRGDRHQIYRIAREHLFADLAVDLNKDADQFVHSESVYLLDQQGYLRGIYNGNVARAMKKLIADLKLLNINRSRIASTYDH